MKSNLLIGPTYTTDIRLGNWNTTALVDTGSVVSVLTKSIVEKYLDIDIRPLSDLYDPSLPEVSFSTADGSKLSYLGYVPSRIYFSSIDKELDSIFLVIPDNKEDSILIGTNILQLLHTFDFPESNYLCKAVKLAHSLLNDFKLVRSGKCVTKIKNNTLNFCNTILNVKPAYFARTVVLSPTSSALSLANVSFADICIDIPKNCSTVDIPYRVCNISSNNVFIPKHFPLFTVSSVQKFVSNQPYNPLTETVPDDEFLELFHIDFEKFSSSESDTIRALLLKHKSLFAFNSFQLGCLKGGEFHIELTDDTPVKQRYRPLHPRFHDRVQEQLKVMLKTGVITESNSSPWNSPMTVVEKSNGELRLCIDYRSLNKQCKKDAKPLPRIEETLSRLEGNVLFSSVDMLSGYWQLPLSKDSKECTAFSAGSGKLYQWERMPFGHTGAGSFFQRCIENVLSGLLYTNCLCYLDDVLIIGKSFSDHCKSLDLVLTSLFEAGLKLKPSKCFMFQDKIKYLGHMVSDKGISTDPGKLSSIKEWPTPTSTKEVRQFYGLASYYRKFLPNFAKVSSPLTELLKGTRVKRGNHSKFVPVPFVWGKSQEQSFSGLKHGLCQNVCLKHPDFSKPFVLELDASRGGLGAVLAQEKDGSIRPVAFASRKTTLSESNYPSHKLEFLALKWAVTKKFKDYLLYNYFDVYTDNNPVAYIVNKLDIDAVSQRWMAELSKFNFKVHYRTGKSNLAADSLSRLYDAPKCDRSVLHRWCNNLVSGYDSVIDDKIVKSIIQSSANGSKIYDSYSLSQVNSSTTECDTEVIKANMYVDNSVNINWKHIQDNDRDIQFVIKNVVNDNNITSTAVKKQNKFIRSLYAVRKYLFMKDNLLYKCYIVQDRRISNQLVLNNSCLEKLFNYYHCQQAHLGEDRTLAIFKDRFYWPGMMSKVKHMVKTCKVCLARKTLPSMNKMEMFHRPVAKHPMDIMSMDHLSIDGQGAYMKILTIVDEFSKFIFVIPVRSERANKTAEVIIKSIFLKYGIPNIIHSDNARSFSNNIIKELCKRTGVIHSMGTPYHSQSNAIAERCQSVILNMLGTLSDKDKKVWYNHCDYISYSYNTTVHASTGFTPYFLMFGRNPKLVGDALLSVNIDIPVYKTNKDFVQSLQKSYSMCREAVIKNHGNSKILYDKKCPRVIKNLRIDDIVLVRKEKFYNKIDNRWSDDMYVVIDQPDEDIPVYKVKNTVTSLVIQRHRNQLLPLYRSETTVKIPITKPKAVKQQRTKTSTCKSSSSSDTHIRQTCFDSDIRFTLKPYDSTIDDDGSNTENTDTVSDTTSDQSDTDSNHDTENLPIKTRSGRVIRPPDRYSPTNYD